MMVKELKKSISRDWYVAISTRGLYMRKSVFFSRSAMVRNKSQHTQAVCQTAWIKAMQSLVQSIFSGRCSEGTPGWLWKDIVGHLSIWHSLQINGMMVPMMVTERLARDLDPVGVKKERHTPWKEETYQNIGQVTSGTTMATTSSNHMGFRYMATWTVGVKKPCGYLWHVQEFTKQPAAHYLQAVEE